jgi:hypothetical protein
MSWGSMGGAEETHLHRIQIWVLDEGELLASHSIHLMHVRKTCHSQLNEMVRIRIFPCLESKLFI